MQLCEWISRGYQHSLGLVLQGTYCGVQAQGWDLWFSLQYQKLKAPLWFAYNQPHKDLGLKNNSKMIQVWLLFLSDPAPSNAQNVLSFKF